MRKLISKIALWSTLELLSLALAHTATAKMLTNKQSQFQHVGTQIESLKENIIQNQQQQTELEQQLKTAELIIGQTGTQLVTLTHEALAQQHILNQLKINQRKKQAVLKNQHDALQQQLRAAYQLDAQNQWKIFFNQENINTANRHFAYYKILNQTRIGLIHTIQQNLAMIQKNIQEIQRHQSLLQHLINQKQQQQMQQQHAFVSRKQLIDALGLQTKSKQQKIDALLANQKELQETITQLNQHEIAISGKSFNQLHGQLNWPVQGTFVANYGSTLDVGNQKLAGVIIKTATGTPVHAIYSGRVIFADWLRGFGLLIIINHGHQYMSLYARNQMLYAKAGHYVKTGDVIATIGNSGGFDKPGLYFEMRQNGTPINPAVWCK